MKIVSTIGDVDKAIKELQKYKQDLDNKTQLFTQRLATLGATRASIDFSRAIIDYNDVEITVVGEGNHFTIRASGEEVAFIEFGSGITYGYGHPQASEFGVGPGTYPSEKGHWNDPKGWRYTGKDGVTKHTYGNPPNMPMYNATREMEQQIEQIAREVFR